MAAFASLAAAGGAVAVPAGDADPDAGTPPEVRPLCEDEHAALRWLDRVTGPLPANEERDWWSIGGTQHGILSKRYHIAFCGYAAAAVGMRGGANESNIVARILSNCIGRFLGNDVWCYSQSKDYWGLKPWAPDPCYRENVMYTGHLLQLLALYELFTGDARYWTEGFDFVWKDDRRVHYDVRKLINVTVAQMRENASGGVTCEPGLLFFSCNNHPHMALRIFSNLGHGDWTADARKWERWALAHFVRPAFGGGAVNLVYHVKSGLFYPRGNAGMDAWSILWYEPWAESRGTALALWRDAASRIDWAALGDPADEKCGSDSCCDPAKVAPTVSAAFLAAAARACGDVRTASRLEKGLDGRYLRRDGGSYWLDLKRDWRIGSTANRIIALAISNGSSFRDLLNPRRPSGRREGGVAR